MVLMQKGLSFFVFSHMGSGIRAFIIFLSLCCASFSMATTLICKNENTIRTLRTDRTPSGCRAVYTKLGVDHIVGSSVHDTNCENIIAGIRKTLEDSVWKCRNIKEAVISNLSE